MFSGDHDGAIIKWERMQSNHFMYRCVFDCGFFIDFQKNFFMMTFTKLAMQESQYCFYIEYFITSEDVYCLHLYMQMAKPLYQNNLGCELTVL